MNESYIVNDLEQYAESIRENAALSFSENYNEDLDLFIAIPQVCQIIKETAIGMDEEDRVIIDEKSYDITFDQIRTRMYNIALAKLASSGEIECAWDNDINDMIFWVADSSAKYKASKNNEVNHESNATRTSKTNRSPKRKNT